MSEQRVTVTLAKALRMIPSGDTVHTLRQSGRTIWGADWPRDKVVEALRQADEIELSGSAAAAMHHGLAIEDERGWLFIEASQEIPLGDGLSDNPDEWPDEVREAVQTLLDKGVTWQQYRAWSEATA